MLVFVVFVESLLLVLKFSVSCCVFGSVFFR